MAKGNVWMTGGSKILTVSYGAFSCKIEGFEDPFAAMREAAEYFRDLTSEDPYFGVIPTPGDAGTPKHLARDPMRLGLSAPADTGQSPALPEGQTVEPELDFSDFTLPATSAGFEDDSEARTPEQELALIARLSRLRGGTAVIPPIPVPQAAPAPEPEPEPKAEPEPASPVSEPPALSRPGAGTTSSRSTHSDTFTATAGTRDAAVSRLIAETNLQLSGAENQRKRLSLRHLKAAVAATVAERRAGLARPVNEERRITPYRDDLSHLVRPQAGGQPRLQPLVLAASQRVDLPPVAAPLPPAPHSPAPVTDLPIADLPVADLDDEFWPEAFTPSTSFEDFADQLGAEDLPQLLEAAGAWFTVIQGLPQFTRPQLLQRVTFLSQNLGATREDGLRAFGILLRGGKIVKLRRGHFGLAETAPMLIEARRRLG